MQNRQNALENWLCGVFNQPAVALEPLAGDASFRRYLRYHEKGQSYIIMDAPPEKEPLHDFIQIARTLRDAQVHTPHLFAVDEAQGFAVLEDLGSRLLLNALDEEAPSPLYEQAMAVIVHMQQGGFEHRVDLPAFDIAFMRKELALFETWFLRDYLHLHLTKNEQHIVNDAFEWLCLQVDAIPKAFVHKDFHSRNLMVCESSPLGVIDFQDAVMGPITYDLVSLLKDCYVQWPLNHIWQWVDYFYTHSPKARALSLAEFKTAFELTGLQRHLKVLGVFARLYLRDGKAQYLNDMPLTLNYVLTALEFIEPLSAFRELIEAKVILP